MGAHAGDVRFRLWQREIEGAADFEQLLLIVRLYLAAWSPEDLAQLPTDLAATSLPERDGIHARAIMASRAELASKGDEPGYPVLREMSLAMTAAATRLRTLESLRSLGRVHTGNVGAMLPGGVQGELEAEVRPASRLVGVRD